MAGAYFKCIVRAWAVSPKMLYYFMTRNIENVT